MVRDKSRPVKTAGNCREPGPALKDRTGFDELESASGNFHAFCKDFSGGEAIVVTLLVNEATRYESRCNSIIASCS